MSKLPFKNLIRKNLKRHHLNIYCQKSKKKEIKYPCLELQEYLDPGVKLSLKEKINIFKFRTRTLDIKTNRKHKYENDLCDECSKKGKIKTESQRHIYKCIELNGNKKQIKGPKYKEIFGNKIDKMKEISEIIHQNKCNNKKSNMNI